MKPLRNFTLSDGLEVQVFRADPSDAQVIRDLYLKVYGPTYSLPEVIDMRRNYEVLKDEDNLWLLARVGDEVIGSLLTLIDVEYGIGKLLAAVVLPQYRRRGILKRMLSLALEHSSRRVDVVYAITRTVDVAPQKSLKRFDFKALGTFPNVRRLRDYETHVLYAKFFNEALNRRLPVSSMIPQVKIFYDLVREELGLPGIKEARAVRAPISFHVENEVVDELTGDQARQAYLERRRAIREGGARSAVTFFPFHVPNYHFTARGWEAFVYYSQVDKHSAIMMLSYATAVDFSRALAWISRRLDQLGARYLELVVDARYPELHKIAFTLGFLPCAYFPAAAQEGEGRVDQVVFSYPLTFPRLIGLKLTREAYKFTLAYLRNMRRKLEMDLQTVQVFD